MSGKKIYEEKQRHGTVEFPVGLHKMEYPEGTDVIFYLHWHKEFELLVLTKGEIVFTIEDREYVLHTGDTVFINSNLLDLQRRLIKRHVLSMPLFFLTKHWKMIYTVPLPKNIYVRYSMENTVLESFCRWKKTGTENCCLF